MLHVPHLRCNRPDDGADGDSGQWMGEKRRKPLDPPLPSDTGEVADFCISSSCSDAPEERAPDQEDPTLIAEELNKYQRLLSKRPNIPVSRGELDLEPMREVCKRLVRCRIIAHKLSKGELSKEECKDTLHVELPPFLQEAVSADELHDDVGFYFRYLDEKEGGTIDWFFDSRSKFEDSGVYQRLFLKNYLPNEARVYWNWGFYRSLFITYEMDKDYVEFVEEMSSKLKWLKNWAGYPEKSDVWTDKHSRGALQAFKIAEKYTHMNFVLAYTAYEEYIWRLRYDCLHRKDKDDLFVEIWKHVTHGKLTFEAALEELLRENLFPQREDLIESAVQKDTWCVLEEEYNACVKGIPGDVSEEDAKALIREAVCKVFKVKKLLHKYMARKMEIAKSIGLVN